MQVKLYHNPRCSKSRQALQLLESKGLEIEKILYLEQGLTSDEVLSLSHILGVAVKDFTRSKEAEFKEYSIDWSDNKQAAKVLSECPKLLERPIVIYGNKAVIARPPEKLSELF